MGTAMEGGKIVSKKKAVKVVSKKVKIDKRKSVKTLTKEKKDKSPKGKKAASIVEHKKNGTVKSKKLKVKAQKSKKIGQPKKIRLTLPERIESVAQYMKTFKTDRSAWKFSYSNQAFLIKKCLMECFVSDKTLKIFLVYAANSKGGVTTWLTRICNTQIQKGEATKKEGDGDTPAGVVVAQSKKMERAKKILAALESLPKA